MLICSYNAQEFVEATIRSVMNQTYGNLEILVRDNASSDKTMGILEKLGGEDSRIKVYGGRENLGAYGGLNYLLDRGKGKYIAIQDHDDIWHSDKIRRQIEYLEQHTDYVGCGTAIINYYEKYDTYLLRRQPTIANIAWHTSIVFRNTGKRYAGSIRIANDFDFMRNILCHGNRLICNLKDPLVLRKIRASGTNLSSKWITAGNIKDIFLVRISLKDKLPILCRLILSERLFDGLILRFLLRRNVVSAKAMKENETLRELVG